MLNLVLIRNNNNNNKIYAITSRFSIYFEIHRNKVSKRQLQNKTKFSLQNLWSILLERLFYFLRDLHRLITPCVSFKILPIFGVNVGWFSLAKFISSNPDFTILNRRLRTIKSNHNRKTVRRVLRHHILMFFSPTDVYIPSS